MTDRGALEADYFKAAMQTLSTTFCLDTPGAPTKDELVSALLQVTAAANIVDAYKKRIYYGKPVTGVKDVSLPVEGFRPESVQTLLHHVMGLITESVELLEVVMLMSRERGSSAVPADLLRHLVEELGDLEWYRAGVYSYLQEQCLDITPQVVQELNVLKLKARYSGGQFTGTGATVRDLGKEDAALSGETDA